MKHIEAINLESFGSSKTLEGLGVITNIQLSNAYANISSTGEANLYIKGKALDANNAEFQVICFLTEESERNLKKYLKSGNKLNENVTVKNAEPFDYVKGVGVTLLNCELNDFSA